MAAGGKAINLGELAIAIALKTGALEQGLKEVQRKLKDHGKKVRGASKDYDKLAIAAGVAFWKITSAVNSGIKAFNDFNNSMVGLRSIVQGTGASFQEAQGFIDDFISDGLIPASDAATALKNLLARGFELGEAVTIMNRFKDAAAFGRQGSLSLGEAVKTATEGIKNENSVLVDNAGVTKNVSVMWKEYAETIGKSVNDLTLAEKRQAELNGIMHETRFQLGDAAKYAKEFAGAQAKNAAESLKLSQALGASMAPVLQTIYEILNPIISVLTEFVKANPALVAAVISITTAFLGLITVMGALGTASKILAPALTALNLSFKGLLVHPAVLALTALVGVLSAVAVKTQQARKAQETYNQAVANHNKLVREGMNIQQAASMQTELDQLKELAATYEETAEKVKEAQATIVSEGQKQTMAGAFTKEHREALAAHADYTKVLDETIAKMKELGATEEDYVQIIKEKERAIFLTTKTTTEDFNAQAKIIAQKKADVLATQAVIEAYKTAEKGSAEWLEAEKKLAESFPQFASMSGIKIGAIEKATQAQADSVEAEWKLTQAKIKMTRMEMQEVVNAKQKELDALIAVQQALEIPTTSDGGLYGMWAEADTPLKNIRKLKAELAELQKEISGMKDIEDINLEEIMGVSPLDLGVTFKSYENKALNTALRIHDHKVRMEELNKEQELASLESILKAYAKTADERMDLEERIYQVKKELREADLEATQKAIEDEAQALADRTAFSERWIAREKSLGNLTVQDEIDAYNRVIKYHKEYLDKIYADTRIAADEKQRIINEETQYIQDQQDKILQLQRVAVEKAVNEYIDAKKKQYDTEEELENERLNAKLKALNKEYSDKQRALETANRKADLSNLYEQERKYANAATKEGQAKLADIRRQIASLKEEEVKDNLKAEHEARKEAIEQEILDNKTKYKKLNEDLEAEKNAMLASALDFAKKANDSLLDSQNEIANSLAGIIRNFDVQTTNLITSGLDKLESLISGYQERMNSLTLTPNVQFGSQSGSYGYGNSSAAAPVTINDYGDKILSGIDEIQDYGKELVIGAQNAARG